MNVSGALSLGMLVWDMSKCAVRLCSFIVLLLGHSNKFIVSGHELCKNAMSEG